ncbi:TetR/AcrR family transcriptional regulator [Nocardia vaccinii]|uniref:TetR/AcrR family transcriptional regulator n=1 Tax=Nocardia vaccinii TaxID=1822 RepID=UPI00082F6A86|nr:TetR/AcrR family transcriptional regulator [Nocardia vaccinii]
MVGELDAVGERILDAALDRMLCSGIGEAGIEEVARCAGLPEPDVLARFPTSEDLVDAVLVREVLRMLAELTAVSVTTDGIDAQIESVSLYILARIRAHPLVTRLLEVTPGESLGFYTVRGGKLVSLGSHYIVTILEYAQGAGLIDRYDPQPAAEMLARLAHSLLLVPEGGTDFRDAERVHAFVLDTIVPLIKHGLPTPAMDRAVDRVE